MIADKGGCVRAYEGGGVRVCEGVREGEGMRV